MTIDKGGLIDRLSKIVLFAGLRVHCAVYWEGAATTSTSSFIALLVQEPRLLLIASPTHVLRYAGLAVGVDSYQPSSADCGRIGSWIIDHSSS
jgi:hypothetical protein